MFFAENLHDTGGLKTLYQKEVSLSNLWNLQGLPFCS